jgi:hypothetical protein
MDTIWVALFFLTTASLLVIVLISLVFLFLSEPIAPRPCCAIKPAKSDMQKIKDHVNGKGGI